MKRFEEMNYEEQLAEAERRNRRRSEGFREISVDDDRKLELAEKKREREKDDRLEKEIQADVVNLLRAYGFRIYNLSQARASKQTPGIGDVYAVSRLRRQILWYETKTPAKKQSPDQIDFEEEHVAAAIDRVRYVVGGVKDAENYLISIGAAERMPDGRLEPIKRR